MILKCSLCIIIYILQVNGESLMENLDENEKEIIIDLTGDISDEIIVLPFFSGEEGISLSEIPKDKIAKQWSFVEIDRDTDLLAMENPVQKKYQTKNKSVIKGKRTGKKHKNKGGKKHKNIKQSERIPREIPKYGGGVNEVLLVANNKENKVTENHINNNGNNAINKKVFGDVLSNDQMGEMVVNIIPVQENVNPDNSKLVNDIDYNPNMINITVAINDMDRGLVKEVSPKITSPLTRGYIGKATPVKYLSGNKNNKKFKIFKPIKRNINVPKFKIHRPVENKMRNSNNQNMGGMLETLQSRIFRTLRESRSPAFYQPAPRYLKLTKPVSIPLYPQNERSMRSLLAGSPFPYQGTITAQIPARSGRNINIHPRNHPLQNSYPPSTARDSKKFPSQFQLMKDRMFAPPPPDHPKWTPLDQSLHGARSRSYNQETPTTCSMMLNQPSGPPPTYLL